MPTVTSDVLSLIFAGLRTDFDEAYKRASADTIYKTIATVAETTLPHQNWAQLGNVGTMRQWIDEREHRSISQLFPPYVLSDQVWEDTLDISRKAIEDDQYGDLKMKAMMLGQEPIRHKEQLVVQAIGAGASVAGMDAAAGSFFSATHAESGVNQSNTITAALTPANLATVITRMMAYTDNAGVPLGIMPTHVLAGPANKFNLKQIIRSALIVSGNTTAAGNINALQNEVEPLISTYFNGAYANYWCVMDLSRPVRPIILQERSDVPVEFTARERPDDPLVYEKDMYSYGLRARYCAGYGLWQTACLGIN